MTLLTGTRLSTRIDHERSPCALRTRPFIANKTRKLRRVVPRSFSASEGSATKHLPPFSFMMTHKPSQGRPLGPWGSSLESFGLRKDCVADLRPFFCLTSWASTINNTSIDHFHQNADASFSIAGPMAVDNVPQEDPASKSQVRRCCSALSLSQPPMMTSQNRYMSSNWRGAMARRHGCTFQEGH